jgi:hypothetical protein
MVPSVSCQCGPKGPCRMAWVRRVGQLPEEDTLPPPPTPADERIIRAAASKLNSAIPMHVLTRRQRTVDGPRGAPNTKCCHQCCVLVSTAKFTLPCKRASTSKASACTPPGWRLAKDSNAKALSITDGGLNPQDIPVGGQLTCNRLGRHPGQTPPHLNPPKTVTRRQYYFLN